MLLKQSEIHLKIHRYCYRRAILFAWFKQPGLYPLNSFLIQAHAQAADDSDITRAAIRTNHSSQDHRALILCLAGFFCEIRLRRELGYRSGYSDVAKLISAAAKSAALSRTMARTGAGT